MKKISFLFIVLLTFVAKGIAQDRLKSLTEERQVLYSKFKESESQSSGIFGNRTKDDMQSSIEALKEIMAKDNEILDELNNLSEKSKSDFTEQYNDLIQQNNEFREKNRELTELSERHKGWSKENHTILESVEEEKTFTLSIAAVVAFLLIVYIIKFYTLKSKYNELKKQQRLE